MAMSTSTADGEVMVEMNTTPLIDVMLVLLTLLIITLLSSAGLPILARPVGRAECGRSRRACGPSRRK